MKYAVAALKGDTVLLLMNGSHSGSSASDVAASAASVAEVSQASVTSVAKPHSKISQLQVTAEMLACSFYSDNVLILPV